MNHGNFFSIQTLSLTLLLLTSAPLVFSQEDSTSTYISFGIWDDDNLPFSSPPGQGVLTYQQAQIRVMDSLGIQEESPYSYTHYKFLFTFTDSLGDTLPQTFPYPGLHSYELEYDLSNLPGGVSYYTDPQNPQSRFLDFRLDMRIEQPAEGTFLKVNYEVWAKEEGGIYKMLLGQTSSTYYIANLCPSCVPVPPVVGAHPSLAGPKGGRLADTPLTNWVYPNPFSGTAMVAPHQTASQLEIRNLQGQLLKQLMLPATTHPYKLNLADLPSGTYLVSRQGVGYRQMLRLVKH